MNKFLLLVIYSLSLFSLHAQNTKTLTGEETSALLSAVGIDSTRMLRSSARTACECIDSVHRTEKDKKAQLKAFSDCIDGQASSYQMATKLLSARKSNNKNIQIGIADKAHYT